jgi:hypothetical protein
MVTHLTTNPPVSWLSTPERTGWAVLKILWSYVLIITAGGVHMVPCQTDLLLPVQVAVKVPAKAGTCIVEAQLLVDAVDLLQVVCVELEVALEVLAKHQHI